MDLKTADHPVDNRSARADEISRSEWHEYLTAFGRQHRGWLVTLERSGATIGRPTVVQGPLESVAFDETTDAVRIVIGDASDQKFDVMIPNVATIRITRTDVGAEWMLDLESRTGDRASLRFRSPVLPEMVDGVKA